MCGGRLDLYRYFLEAVMFIFAFLDKLSMIQEREYVFYVLEI